MALSSTKVALLSSLVLATVLVLCGTFCVSIAFAGTSWEQFSVDTDSILAMFYEDSEFHNEFTAKIRLKPHRSDLAYSRQVGLFQECFTDKVPQGYEVHTGPFGHPCIFRWSEMDGANSTNAEYNMRVHLVRAQFILYALGLAILVIGLVIGFCGCYSQRSGFLLVTGICLFVAVLTLICAMVVFHGVSYVSSEIDMPGMPYTWPMYLQKQTVSTYGWSYFLAWVGISLVLIGSITIAIASVCLRYVADNDTGDDNEPALPEKKKKSLSEKSASMDVDVQKYFAQLYAWQPQPALQAPLPAPPPLWQPSIAYPAGNGAMEFAAYNYQ